MDNPIFTAKADALAYRDRYGRHSIGAIYAGGETLMLMDCDFTDGGYGIMRDESGLIAWVHRDHVDYVSGNLGDRASDTPIDGASK